MPSFSLYMLGDKSRLIKNVFIAFCENFPFADTSRPENVIHNKHFNYISKNIMSAKGY